MEEFGLFYGGAWRQPAAGATYSALNPYDGQAWATVPDATEADVTAAVASADEALHGDWGRMTGFERSAALRQLAVTLEAEAERLAEIESRGNGKLIRETLVQARSLPEYFTYFSGLADKLEGASIPSFREGYLIYTREEPVGVVAAITPWNSPLLLLTWKAAPALAAGATMVIKPSPLTPVSTLEFARCVHDAGIPAGVVNVVTGRSPELGAALVSHPDVSKVSFTGSTEVGREVGKGAVSGIKSVALELGGKSAQVVFADADLDRAVNGILSGIFAASGQTCVAGSRLLVERSVHDDFVARLVARAETIKLGDPLDPESEMGPLASEDQRARVQSLVDQAVAAGATVAHGGEVDREAGALFFKPTILTGLDDSMDVLTTEVFGPVLVVLPFDGEAEAIEMANLTEYGLAAGVWTQGIGRAHRVADQLEAGSVWVNCYRLVAPNAPFGGVKASGIGRENGREAIKEFTETKTVWIATDDGEVRDPFTIG